MITNPTNPTNPINLKLIWIISEPSLDEFYIRLWPSAEFEDGSVAVNIICDAEYDPVKSRTNNHPELEIRVARHHNIESRHGGFQWVILSEYAKTLKEAKTIAQDFIYANPDYQP